MQRVTGKTTELVSPATEHFLAKTGLSIEERCRCNVSLSVYLQPLRELIFYAHEIFSFHPTDPFILCSSQKSLLGELNCTASRAQMNFT